jgi:ubiquinone/menaquinone biosynthesis C-methylase UbiE
MPTSMSSESGSVTTSSIIGCGAGVVTRELSLRVGPTGRVVGLDPSPVMLWIAREIAEQAG